MPVPLSPLRLSFIQAQRPPLHTRKLLCTNDSTRNAKRPLTVQPSPAIHHDMGFWCCDASCVHWPCIRVRITWQLSRVR
jgi:hypothetical protein